MRIFYAAPSSPNSRFQSNLWRDNLRGSLVRLGNEIIDFDYDLSTTFQNVDPSNPEQAKFIARNQPDLSDALVSQVRKSHAVRPIDLLFTYFYNACVLPGIVRELGSLGIVTVNWFCNASYQFHLVSEIAPEYHFCLVPEKFRLQDYRKIGAKPIYCQEAGNPDVYFPYAESEQYDVGFVGQAYGERPELVRWLVKRGVKVYVWGSGWEYYRQRRPSWNPLRWTWGPRNMSPMIPRRLIGGILSDEEVVRTFSRTRINLGFAGCWINETSAERITQIRLRDFEIPMSGGFYLTEYQEELGEFFDLESEIACYRNKEDLLEKIRFYLGRSDLRKMIRERGRSRCLREHTWTKRFEKAFKEMGLKQ